MDTAKKAFQLLFHPKSIAVIGASNNEFKPGGRVIKNIIEHGFEGTLWAVNPKDDTIQGIPASPSIEALPEAPDLAIVGIPARFVLPSVIDLGKKGVKAVIVLSAGFGEKDEEGKAVERQLVSVAKDYNMILIGPNCSGFLTPTYKGKFAGLIPTQEGAGQRGVIVRQ